MKLLYCNYAVLMGTTTILLDDIKCRLLEVDVKFQEIIIRHS